VRDRVACPGCGADIPATGVCRFCGATALVDGVAGRLLPSDLACPRCPGNPPLQGVEHEGFRADFCGKCRGVWFGLGMLEEVVRTAVKRPLRRGEGGEGPAHGGLEPVRYALCPRCRGGMARVPFAQKPLVIIDRCPAHGDWCDGGELQQLKAIARSRGVDEALGRAEESRAARKQAEREAGARAMAGFGEDPLIAELRKRPGNWGVVPPEVEAMDAAQEARRSAGHPLGLRRRRGRDLFDLLWFLFKAR
jgi:Zn-finger nucleic acid-binding protein